MGGEKEKGKKGKRFIPIGNEKTHKGLRSCKLFLDQFQCSFITRIVLNYANIVLYRNTETKLTLTVQTHELTQNIKTHYYINIKDI